MPEEGALAKLATPEEDTEIVPRLIPLLAAEEEEGDVEPELILPEPDPEAELEDTLAAAATELATL